MAVSVDEQAAGLLKDIANTRRKPANRRASLHALLQLCALDRGLVARLTLPPTQPLPHDDAAFGADDDARAVRAFFWSVDAMVQAIRDGESTLLARVAPWCALHAQLAPERGRALRDALVDRCGDASVVRGGHDSCGNVALVAFCDVVRAGVSVRDVAVDDVGGLLLPALLAAGTRGELLESGGPGAASVLARVPLARLLTPVLVDAARPLEQRMAAWFVLSVGDASRSVDGDVVGALALDDKTPAALRPLCAAWCIEHAPRHALALQRAGLVESVDVPENAWAGGGHIDTLVKRVRIDDVVAVLGAAAVDDAGRRRRDTALTLVEKLLERIPSLFPLVVPPLLVRLDDDDAGVRRHALRALHAGAKREGAAVAAYSDVFFAAVDAAGRRGELSGITALLVLVPGATPRVHALLRAALARPAAALVDVTSALLLVSPVLDADDSAAVVAAAVAANDDERRRLVRFLMWRSAPLARVVVGADAGCFPAVEDVFGYHHEERGRLEGLHPAPVLCAALAGAVDDVDAVLGWLRSSDFPRAAAMAAASGAWCKAHVAARAVVVDELLRFSRRTERHRALVEERQPEEFGADVAAAAVVDALFAPPADLDLCERVVVDVDVAVPVRLDVVRCVLELSHADAGLQRRARAVVVAFVAALAGCDAAVASAVVSRMPSLLFRRFSDVEPLLELWATDLVLRADVDHYVRGASIGSVRETPGLDAAGKALADRALAVLRARAVDDDALRGILQLNRLL